MKELFDIERIRGFEKISLEQFKKDFHTILSKEYGRNAVYRDEDIFDVIAEKELDKIKLPSRGTALSAGYDFYTPIDIALKPGEEINIPTGIKSYMQADEVLMAYPRSSHGFKYYIRLANNTGIIDADFFDNEDNEGHIYIKIRNEGKRDFYVKKGTAIAQFIFQKYLLADGDSFEGEKRSGGIGSTDG